MDEIPCKCGYRNGICKRIQSSRKADKVISGKLSTGIAVGEKLEFVVFQPTQTAPSHLDTTLQFSQNQRFKTETVSVFGLDIRNRLGVFFCSCLVNKAFIVRLSLGR